MKNQAVIVALVAAGTLLFSVSKIRGIRNNNWLNIKYNPANDWDGQIGRDEKGYVKFSHPIYSLRAGFRLLNTYATKYGLTSIRQIVTRFAPPIENNTAAYIASVSQQTGIPPDQPLMRILWPRVITAMVKHEVGKQVPLDMAKNAKKMAGV